MDKLTPKFLVSCFILNHLIAGGIDGSICWKKPPCACTGAGKATVYCRNVQDLSDVVGLFKNLTPLYKIRVHGAFTTIPSRAFDGVSVSFLSVTAPLKFHLPRDSLFGIEHLRTVILNLTSYQSIPAVFSNQNYSMFQSTRGKLTEITGELQNMHYVTEMLLNKNQISSISPDAFYNTNSVQLLDLSYNELTYLHSKTLEPMALLEEIYLQNNQLQHLDGCLRHLNPKIINLYGNNLTSVDNALHGGMWNLQYLNVGGNPQVQMSTYTFNSSMKSLSKLHLSNNEYDRLDSVLIKHLWNLHELYLNGNHLSFIPRYFFEHNPFISVLQLSNNRLRSVKESMVNRREWYNWMKLSLDGNQLQHVQFGSQPLLISDLDISRNQISCIKAGDMIALRRVTKLNLSENGLHSLDSSSFKNFHSLTDLDLSYNNLTHLNGSLKGLSKLYILNLRFAGLEYLSADEFHDLYRIKSLNLRDNSLSSVHGAFKNLRYISNLDIANNNLTTLTTDSFPPFKKTSIRVRTLWMAENPWSCDCRIAWMTNWVTRQGSKLLDEPICSSPEHLYNRTIRSLSSKDYEKWLYDCPEACNCICKAEGDLIYTEVWCTRKDLSKVPEVLPSNARSLDLRGNLIESFDGHDVLRLEHLRLLNLENNKLEKVRLVLPPEISSLLLAHNSLRTFPVEEWSPFMNVSKITLSNNPWICNCETWPFRNWLIRHNGSISDIQEVKCSSQESFHLKNKPIISLTQQDLCSYLSNIMILSVCSVILLVLCLLSFCYRHSLVALLYYCGCSCLKKSHTHDYEYDAFLMYSEDDEEFALGELATGLEVQKHPFILCIPSRDIPSPRTQQKINTYLPRCNKLIVLLTRSFIESRECVRLLISAMSFSSDRKKRCVIFVCCGELPSIREMDPVLKTLMLSSTLLRWNQQLFWQKLIYQLPRKGVKKNEHDDEDDEPLLES